MNMPANITRPDITECAYCARDVRDRTNEPPPAVTDHQAWAALRREHAPGCDWIATRAHRINGALL